MQILWLKTELLHPLDKGGRIRTYNMLRELARGHRITYLTLDEDGSDEAITRASEYCAELVRIPVRTPAKGSISFYRDVLRNLASSLPYAIWKYRSSAMRATIEDLVRRRRVDVIVCDFLAPAVNVPEKLTAPTVLFEHNVEAQIWARRAALATNALEKRYLDGQWARMHRFERAQCRRFDHVVAVSPDDADYIAREYSARHVSEIPTGVDTTFFRPSKGRTPEPNHLVFIGSMDWSPNEDAMSWFIREILPRVRSAVPGVTLSIVGRNPTPSLLAFTEQHGVHVTGTVADVRPYLERAAVNIVPLRIGGGTRLKIFEAMAMENAVVSTTIGAEGLPISDNEHLLIADAPESFSDAILRLLRDPAEAARLSRNAATLVRTQFSWDRVASVFAQACSQVSFGSANAILVSQQ